MKLFAIVGPDGMYITAAHKYPGWAWVELRNELDKVHADDISTDEIMHLIALGFVCIELHTYDPSKHGVYDKETQVVMDIGKMAGGIDITYSLDDKSLKAGDIK